MRTTHSVIVRHLAEAVCVQIDNADVLGISKPVCLGCHCAGCGSNHCHFPRSLPKCLVARVRLVLGQWVVIIMERWFVVHGRLGSLAAYATNFMVSGYGGKTRLIARLFPRQCGSRGGSAVADTSCIAIEHDDSSVRVESPYVPHSQNMCSAKRPVIGTKMITLASCSESRYVMSKPLPSKTIVSQKLMSSKCCFSAAVAQQDVSASAASIVTRRRAPQRPGLAKRGSSTSR